MIRNLLLAATATAAFAAPAFAQDMNIVETAQEAGTFTTLLAAAEAAGLVETLTGEGPLTVFAPTDEAFEALPQATVDSLLLEENREQLVDILTYHVVAGSVMSGDLVEGEVTAVNGDALTIDLGNGVMINDATVTAADIQASNGVIHVIDTVLMPPSE
jgi:uncharacterized surface protein with fasciclin (FAS1) repeats